MSEPAREYLRASDAFLAKLEAAGVVDKKEEESTRKSLARQVRNEAKRSARNLETAQVGGSKILVPTSANLRLANLISERTRRRMSDFSLSYLNPQQVRELQANGSLQGTSAGQFVRHSRRSARHMREFLGRIGELEPDLREEVDATLAEIEDAKNDLLKLEIRSFTQMRERLVRSINGREKRSALVKEIDAWDLNRSIWNLSLLEHPKATVQQMLARSSTRMAERVTEQTSRLPKVAHVMVGIPPGAQKKMTPESRTASLVWRLFSQEELDRAWERLPQKQEAQGSWRGLGLSYNTAEWYVPVPPEIVDDLRPILSARRAAALEAARRIKEKAL